MMNFDEGINYIVIYMYVHRFWVYQHVTTLYHYHQHVSIQFHTYLNILIYTCYILHIYMFTILAYIYIMYISLWIQTLSEKVRLTPESLYPSQTSKEGMAGSIGII